MRKRNTKEILELSSLQVRSFSENIDPELNKQQEVVNKERKKREDAKAKAGYTEVRRRQIIRQGASDALDAKQKRKERIEKAERQKKKDELELRRKSDETAEKNISAATSRAEKIAGKKPNLERISSKDKSVTATGKAAMNTAKSVVSLGRKVASIPDRLQAKKAKSDYGKTQMDRGEAPTGGTKRQRIGYATKASRQRINTAVSNTRKKIGRGIEGIGKRIIPEDFIHEAEKGKKEIKKEKIDVMKGTNKIEVNPKVQAEAKKMTKSQIEKRDEIADAISTREMNKRYGDKNVKYAIATKLAMKKKKKKGMCEAKVDKEKSPIYSLPRTQARNERRFGKKGSLEPQGFFGQKPSEAAELSKKRTDEHKARRGVKNESVSGIEVQNVSDGIKFREYEFIDVVKPEPMRSPKNNITWTEGKGSNPNKRYLGDPIVTSKKSFTKTGKIGIDYYTDDEKKKSEKEQLKNVKDPKRNISRNKVGQSMQMLKRMTPEQKYARKMRIEKQKKDKK